MSSENRLQAIDVHSHWSTRRGYPLQTEAELTQQETHLAIQAGLSHRSRDGRGFSRCWGACDPRFRLHQIPADRGGEQDP